MTDQIWTAAKAEAASVSLYPGEYLCVVAFVRTYADDCDCLDASGSDDASKPVPQRLAGLLSRELQEACDVHGCPAGRWQVLAVDAPQ